MRCDRCNASRRLVDAFGRRGEHSLPLCRGRRPHLRDYDPEECNLPSKAILLGTSNLWFPNVITALAMPVRTTSRLDELVAEQWIVLQHGNNVEIVAFMQQIGQLVALIGYDVPTIWAAIQGKRQQVTEGVDAPNPTELKTPEWAIFTYPETTPATKDFRLRAVAVPSGFADLIERVVLVEQLREVCALIGFIRIDAPGELGKLGPRANDRRALLSRRPPTWIPAAEVRGEGIFIQFREAAIQQWLAGPEVEL